MSGSRSKFAGGDQAYLRHEQYRDPGRLARRANLHVKYRGDALPWFDFVRPHLDLAPGQRVLDVGCGPGWLWEAVDIPAHLTLVDLSPGMVAEARPRAAASGRLATVAGATADVQALPFPDGYADRVVANHMLYHAPDPARAVAELARVVRPGGAVIVSTNGRHHMRPLRRIQADVLGGPEVDDTITAFGAETGFGVLRDHFAAVAWHGHPHELRCTDPADVMAYLCSTPPAEDAGAAAVRRLAAAVEARFAADGGVLSVTADPGCFVCRR
jgi:SAM-dependent methyltransferase